MLTKYNSKLMLFYITVAESNNDLEAGLIVQGLGQGNAETHAVWKPHCRYAVFGNHSHNMDTTQGCPNEEKINIKTVVTLITKKDCNAHQTGISCVWYATVQHTFCKYSSILKMSIKISIYR